MNVVSQRLLGEVSWGVKMRVFAGAGLSILDMATDISVVVTYWDSELHRIGLSLLAMILLSIVFQLTISVIQNMKKPSVMGSEVLIVLTGLKPAFDAFRVASGRDVEGYKTVNHLTELNACKGAEMFAESIPGCVVRHTLTSLSTTPLTPTNSRRFSATLCSKVETSQRWRW